MVCMEQREGPETRWSHSTHPLQPHRSRWNWGRGVQPLPCGQSWHSAGLKYGRREDRTGCTTLIRRLASLFVLWGITVMRGRPDTELPSVLDQGDSPHARPRRPSYREKAASRLPFELPGFRASQELLFCSINIRRCCYVFAASAFP